MLISSPSASASSGNIYIAPAATGAANGSDCSDAYSASWFNASANWGSGSTQIGPGTTVHLCSGTYSYPGTSCGLTFQGSGNSSASITLIADQGTATITAQAWQSSSGLVGPICTGSYNYLVINGANNLTLQATNNGTLLAYQGDHGNGIVGQSSNYLTIENLTISNIYVHACTEPYSNCTDENGQSTGCISASGSNVTIAYVTAHDAKWCINGGSGTGVANSNQVFHDNKIYNVDHGIAVGMGGASSTLNGLLIYNNDISNFINWDDAAVNNHHDGIHMWSYNSGDVISGAKIYNNYIHGDFGAAYNAGIYMEAMTGAPGTVYFNNVIVDGSSVSHNGCGEICLLNNGATVVNNTVIGTTGHTNTAFNLYGSATTVKNNIAQGVAEGIAFPNGLGGAAVDYNNYYNIGGNGWNNNGSFSGWQSSCSCESHSSTTNPNLASNFVPTSSSTAVISKGLNLSGMSVTPLNFDRVGLVRPSMPTSWTIGAYNYNSGTTVNPPTNLSAVSQ